MFWGEFEGQETLDKMGWLGINEPPEEGRCLGQVDERDGVETVDDEMQYLGRHIDEGR